MQIERNTLSRIRQQSEFILGVLRLEAKRRRAKSVAKTRGVRRSRVVIPFDQMQEENHPATSSQCATGYTFGMEENPGQSDRKTPHLLRWLIASASVSIIILVALSVGSNRLRWSDASVRAWLLTKTPLGSSRAVVLAVLEQHGWNNKKFPKIRPGPSTEPFLGGEIGSYQGFPWYTSVRALWEFDSSDRLVSLEIERVLDSP